MSGDRVQDHWSTGVKLSYTDRYDRSHLTFTYDLLHGKANVFE